nr:substrate-binding domain-containing protein [Variibacter gotjawalensis]
MAGGAMRAPLNAIAARYREVAGVAVAYHFGTTPELIALALSDQRFDLGVVPQDVLKNADALATFATDTITDVAYVGLGIAVPKGAPKPDIGTADALKKTLLAAKSIAAIPESAAGYQAARVYATLGISDAINAKTVVKRAPLEIVAALAAREAELGIFFSNILMSPDVDLLDGFPSELQELVAFRSGLCARTEQTELADAFLRFLADNEARAIIASHGMAPANGSSAINEAL